MANMLTTKPLPICIQLQLNNAAFQFSTQNANIAASQPPLLSSFSQVPLYCRFNRGSVWWQAEHGFKPGTFHTDDQANMLATEPLPICIQLQLNTAAFQFQFQTDPSHPNTQSNSSTAQLLLPAFDICLTGQLLADHTATH